MYKLIVSDLDDTLLGDDLIISERNKEVISEAMKSGYMFTIATGRATEAAVTYANELNITLPIITYQGACIYDCSKNEYIHSDELEKSKILSVIEYAEKNNIHCNIYTDGVIYIKEHNKWSEYYGKLSKELEKVCVGSLLDFDFDKTIKLILIDDYDKLETIKTEVEELVNDKINIFYSKSNFIEITNEKATKGNAVEKLAQMYGIDMKDVIAIGDSYNDLTMIQRAGLGVCMENGRDDVKKAADYITLSNEDNGVAEAIDRFVFGKVLGT